MTSILFRRSCKCFLTPSISTSLPLTGYPPFRWQHINSRLPNSNSILRSLSTSPTHLATNATSASASNGNPIKTSTSPVRNSATNTFPVSPPPQTARSSNLQSPPPSSTTNAQLTSATPITAKIDSFSDEPPAALNNPHSDDPTTSTDWTRSFRGLSAEPFSPDATAVLTQPIAKDDVEVKPDGMIYLPGIKYRRILNKAFGPGGWGLAPRGESIVTPKVVTREYALIAHGRLVSIARGEQQYFAPDGIPTATEGCKSNALMRCCKDLGVASELWDPRFIREFKKQYVKEIFVEHVATKKKTKIWIRKDDEVKYPWKETK